MKKISEVGIAIKIDDIWPREMGILPPELEM
jgi:hypothetical protein